jgi:queuosine precursor transporter
LGAVTLSNTVGLLVDSVLFLWLAFGSLAFLPGQLVGKAWMTGLAILLLAGGRRAVLARHAHAELA